MSQLIEFLKGKKTYITAAVALIYGVVVLGIGNHDWAGMIDFILASSSIASVRAAMTQQHQEQLAATENVVQAAVLSAQTANDAVSKLPGPSDSGSR